jgi:general secretion pathway protein J
MEKRYKGFTLLEMLVVLVILAMTTSLLSTGLATTWQNFLRLGARDLIVSSTKLPARWFRDSVKHALLYHPDKVLTQGSSQHFKLVSAAVPNDRRNMPQSLEWMIYEDASRWSLAFVPELGERVVVKESTQAMEIEYWIDDQWQNTLSPKNARLPAAVRILENGDTWVMAVPGRPIEADVPAEMALFGRYEFE